MEGFENFTENETSEDELEDYDLYHDDEEDGAPDYESFDDSDDF